MSPVCRPVTGDLEQEILSLAQVPEHIVPMMTALSGGSPFVAADYLMFQARDWLIFIGYPLGRGSATESFSDTLRNASQQLGASTVWLIGPNIPPDLVSSCRNMERDAYYRLDCTGFETPHALRRHLRQASRRLSVTCDRTFTDQHERLSARYVLKLTVPERVKALYAGLKRYVEACGNARVLSAWDRSGNLAAFQIVDLAAARFACYLIGGHSTAPYVPHASDLLFLTMVTLAQEYNKDYIHLGLGVNQGIRRFKVKWGGIPFLPYACGEYSPPGRGIGRMLRALISSR